MNVTVTARWYDCSSLTYAGLTEVTKNTTDTTDHKRNFNIVNYLGLSEAASAAFSCPASAVLDYRYAVIFFTKQLCVLPIQLPCHVLG